MARTDAQSIKESNDSASKLAEKYTLMIGDVQKEALSIKLKAQDYTGDPLAGSVEYNRLETSVARTYGTARTAGAGDPFKKTTYIVNLDQHKEIVEEYNKKDVQRIGLPDLVARKKAKHKLAVLSAVDTAFFAAAESAGTEVDVSAETSLVKKVNKLIRSVETTKNDFVDGVPREMLVLTLSPEFYDELTDYIHTLPNPSEGGQNIRVFKNVEVYSNFRQTKDAIVMAKEAVAQPVAIDPYDDSVIPLSREIGVGLFFDYGTTAIMPDLIAWATLGDEPSA